MSIDLKISGDQIYAPLKNAWLPLTEEERIKQEFIIRLVNFYGYDVGQLGQDVEIKKKVKVDIAIWKNRADKDKKKVPSIIIAVECKAEHVSIKKSDILLSYKLASSVNASFFIATNLKETKIYHILDRPVFREFERIGDIPRADKILSDRSLNEYLRENKAFTRDEFSKLLFKCHSIIRNNDKLSPEAAFDEISKILFMKIMYEKKSKEELIFSLEKFRSLEKNYESTIRPTLKRENPNFDLDYMQFQFNETKRNFAKDDIFDVNDRIRIRRNSFEQIVKELESYNLSDTSDDVKGIAFEEFLGKTFRGELGQFFTPRTIVDYMVEILDPQEGERICDPCCGSGGFLIKAFEYVKEKIERDIQAVKEGIKGNHNVRLSRPSRKGTSNESIEHLVEKLNLEFDLQNENGRLRFLSYECIFGTDANPRMARTAKMNMIMHGDGHGGVHHHDGLLNVNGIFDERFDVILTNPPFGSRVEKSSVVSPLDIPNDEKRAIYKARYGDEYDSRVIQPLLNWAGEKRGNKGTGKPIIDLFEVGKMSALTEVLFIERSLQLLKPGGRMGIVLPEGVLNTGSLQKVREFFEGKAKIINITSIPQDVFVASGATVKPSLLFLKKFTEEETSQFQSLTTKVVNEVNRKFSKVESELVVDKNAREKKAKQSRLKLRKLDPDKAITQKSIEARKLEEIKKNVKAKFDYPIAVVEVEKAGITSTGAKTENELEAVAIEFKRYVDKYQPWAVSTNKVVYRITGHNSIERTWIKDDLKVVYEII